MDVVYAKRTGHVGSGVVRKGTHWPADDPVVKAHPDMFSSDPRYGLSYSAEPKGWSDPPVEQATAAPGEKRQIRRGASRD
jgi:hypothetical protein